MAVDWFPDWRGKICAVVASGPSATPETIAKIEGRCRVIVVNNGYQLAPWADVLYAPDARWWDSYKDARNFAGLKITQDAWAAVHYKLRCVQVLDEIDPRVHEMCFDEPGLIGRGGNGGFQALNLTVQFGAERVMLVGFDFCGDHWHGEHPMPLKNPSARTLDKWRARLDAQAYLLARRGIDVVNVSEVSALTAYPKMTLADAFNRYS